MPFLQGRNAISSFDTNGNFQVIRSANCLPIDREGKQRVAFDTVGLPVTRQKVVHHISFAVLPPNLHIAIHVIIFLVQSSFPDSFLELTCRKVVVVVAQPSPAPVPFPFPSFQKLNLKKGPDLGVFLTQGAFGKCISLLALSQATGKTLAMETMHTIACFLLCFLPTVLLMWWIC